jgi:hypothetical protein
MGSVFEKIILGNVVFGSSYKIGILWDATIETPGGEPNRNKMRPMLMGEKIGVFLWGTAMSPVLAPLWMCNQLNYLDIYRQGKTPKDFGYNTVRKSLLDYVFT